MILTFQQQQNTTTHARTQWIACFAVFRSRREHVYGYFAFHRKQQKRNMFSMCWMISIVNHTNEYVTHTHMYITLADSINSIPMWLGFFPFLIDAIYIFYSTHILCVCVHVHLWLHQILFDKVAERISLLIAHFNKFSLSPSNEFYNNF